MTPSVTILDSVQRVIISPVLKGSITGLPGIIKRNYLLLLINEYVSIKLYLYEKMDGQE